MAAKRTAEAVSLLRAGDVRELLARYADLALAAVVVSIVGMMIVPLPTLLLDLLITVDIAAAVVLLLGPAGGDPAPAAGHKPRHCNVRC